MKDQYVNEFERWSAGTPARKQQLRAELEAHLEGAEQAGELDAALQRLGTPRDAAQAFAAGHELPTAPLVRRVLAFIIDGLIPFGVAALGMLISAGFGPGGPCPGASNVGCASRIEVGPYRWDNVEVGVGAALLVAVAIFWWVLGLTIMEWRTGRTPGKAIMGLRVVSESGIAPSFGQVLVRRLTLVFSGPLQVIDWAFALFDDRHQRGLDKLARTLVITDAPKATSMTEVAASAL